MSLQRGRDAHVHTLAGALLPREGILCTRRAVLGAKSATVTMSLCAWKHSYDALFSCTRPAQFHQGKSTRSRMHAEVGLKMPLPRLDTL